MQKGIIYVNSSHHDGRYVREAEKSALSFRRFIPDARFILYTDAVGIESSVFDAVYPVSFDIPVQLAGTDHKNGQMTAKLHALRESPFEYTMYLGSDTYALDQRAATLFSLLDRFDIAAAHAPQRINVGRGNTGIPDVPACFPEFNCDLILFRSSDAIDSFMAQWEKMYLEHAFGHSHDQGAFRYLVYCSELRIATLAPEYNYRGNELREDTIILQNRRMLASYLEGGRSGSRDGLIRKAYRRLLAGRRL